MSIVDADMDKVDPYNDCKAVCFLNGEFTVKRVDMTTRIGLKHVLHSLQGCWTISPDDECTIYLGVVTWIIKKV